MTYIIIDDSTVSNIIFVIMNILRKYIYIFYYKLRVHKKITNSLSMYNIFLSCDTHVIYELWQLRFFGFVEYWHSVLYIIKVLSDQIDGVHLNEWILITLQDDF